VLRRQAVVATLVCIVVGCARGTEGSGSQMSQAALPPTATVTYEFHDSSVPPPFHRSFVLMFTRERARIVVDSYGDILADQDAPMTAAVWDEVSQSFSDLSDIVIEEPEQGCTGGTAFAVSVADVGVTSFSLHGSACGGANSHAEERLQNWVRPVRVLFPPMDQLAPEGNR
jgi:hypothetical protein